VTVRSQRRHQGEDLEAVRRVESDVDVLDWFRNRRFLYQDEINEALRAYMEAHSDEDWVSGRVATPDRREVHA
jgi:uncharacterized protein (DUF4415 family)